MTPGWRTGNAVDLLENGEEFFPRVFEAIDAAEREVLVETFILKEDPVGRRLQRSLIRAVRRGAQVHLALDGFGCGELAPDFVARMTDSGVHVRFHDPRRRLFGMRTNLFRRTHRKIVTVDGRIAFVGGINFIETQNLDSGPDGMRDYAVAVRGPLVEDIRRAALELTVASGPRPWLRWLPPPPADDTAARAGPAEALFVTRDDGAHRNGIETQYREALRGARKRIVIANAYFFPGYRFLRELRDAAGRGVKVQLILQGKPDKPWARWASTALYDYLLAGGVRIAEYREGPLHAKVAVVDDAWATVGSSNLDPLSLFLNLEANVFVRDRPFAQRLAARLQRLLLDHCEEVPAARARHRSWLRQLIGMLAFHVLRHFPSWAGWLPGHKHAALVPLPAPRRRQRKAA